MEEAPGYKFITIRTKQFAFFESEWDPKNDELGVNRSFSFGIEPETGIFSILLAITYIQEDKPILKIETEAIFQLNNASLDSFINKERNTFTMPVAAVRSFTSMLYGATRGILVCKLEGTPLASVILPPIDIKETINRQLTIRLK